MIYLLALLLNLEHAVTKEQHKQGLMGREELAENQGMLFHFEECRYRTFWMYGCKIDLDVAFLDRSGTIFEIHTLKAYPNEFSRAFFCNHAAHSSEPVAFALEMPAGYFDEHEIGPGSHLTFDLDSNEATLELYSEEE